MRTNTSSKIIEYIESKGHAMAKDLVNHLEISPQAVFKQLARLLKDDKIYKIGKAPKTFYSIKKPITESINEYLDIDDKTREIIKNSFLIITPTGQRKEGMDGFSFWCQRTGQSIEKTAKEYVKTVKKYDIFKKNGLIDGLHKLKSSFPKTKLDNLFYLDFYSIERFGKTKLGQILLYAKQSQSKILIKEIVNGIKPRIEYLIKKHNIDAIGFIPPTVKRETQLMEEMKRMLYLDMPTINIIKVHGDFSIPQKTLNKIQDRVENAQKTIIVDENKKYKNILLIDDAVGSGATLNETASQIKTKEICSNKIIGLAITGSFKGFDVISEV